jgi:ABC-2 type transport system permease protein
MKSFLTLWRRELADYFISPVAYIVCTMFLALMGLGFWFIANLRLVSGASVTEIYQALYGGISWLGILMMVPLLSMRSFADEKRSGTLETLLTAPVRDGEVVAAKFLGVFTVYLLCWLPTLAYFPLLNRLNDQPVPVDPGSLAAAYIGIGLVGGFYLSIGVLCSSLTRNAIVAAISTFTLCGFHFLGGFLPDISPLPALQEWSRPFSPVYHLVDFSRGLMDIRPVVFYLSGMVLMQMVTLRVLESRRWRS